jgi:hypothetical protein
MTYTLTILDVSGVQKYLFDSNRLPHNLGASYLVEQAIKEWVEIAVKDWKAGNIEGGANYEIVYSGGGNVVLLFDSRDRAIEFSRRYTKHLLANAPGLRVVVQHTDFEWSQSLADVYTKALRTLAEKKAEQSPVMPMLGLGVTAACQYTGLPAIKPDSDDDNKRISAEVAAKVRAHQDARSRLKKDFVDELGEYEFAYDFNLFGERDKASYSAVVHADGNGMGKRKEAICQDPENRTDNRKFIYTLRQFSEEVKKAGARAMQETFARLMNWIGADEQRFKDFTAWDEEKKVRRVKFVPLVFGGDDVTFVCDGRLGLSLAAIFLQEFNKQRLAVDGKPLYACAGAAIVKNRFPFARAYDIAEALCQSAKRAVKEWQVNEDEDALALDWHFAVSGAVLSLGEVRKREYTVKDGKLYVRPYLINAPREPLKSWRAFQNIVGEFKAGDDWKSRRNKVKELREQLRQGPEATQQFRKLFELPKLPEISNVSDYREGGWHGSTCAYFDAIEAMDLFVDMEENA